MAFDKISVVKFNGLNSTVAPELIQDGDARDILNFRMEKVGKLVSRDGTTIGLEIMRWSDALPLNPNEYKNDIAVNSYINNKGIVGIGEMILSEYWQAIDSDRFMVYAIRGGEVDIDDENRYKYDNKMVFLISPLTGRYKNKLMVYGNLLIKDKVDIDPQGMGTNYRQLYAPNRKIIGWDYTKEDNWIKQYIDMNQYRYKLIISDRTNGDMVLEDEYDRAEIKQGIKNEHKLTLRPNCLATFDIDIVEIDYRFGADEENDKEKGVENGMALYGYKLQKSIFKGSSSNTKQPLFGDLEYFAGLNDTKPEDAVKARNRIVHSIDNNALKLKFNLVNIFPSTEFKNGYQYYKNFTEINSLQRRNDIKYYFSNYYNDAENYDTAKSLIFEEDEFIDENGKLKKEYASNVYVWDKFKLKYYPCSTINYINFLTFADMFYNKLIPKAPRMFTIPQREGIEAKAPVGMYKYRFVWDYGDGVYSAPSAELVVPDIIYSAVKDEYVNYTYKGEPLNVRLGAYEHEHLKNSSTSITSPYQNSTDIIKFNIPLIYDNTSQQKLTPVGELLYKLKKELYGQQYHRFGIKDNLSIEDINNGDSIIKGDFATLITLDCTATNHIEFAGYIADMAAVSTIYEPYYGGAWQDNVVLSTNPYTAIISYRDNMTPGYFWGKSVKLAISLFPLLDIEKIISVFDNYGRLRTAYSRHRINLGGQDLFPNYRVIIFPGFNSINVQQGGFLITDPYFAGRQWTSDILFAGRSDKNPVGEIAWLGIFAHHNDKNNHPEEYYLSQPLYLLRPNTIIRGVNVAEDNLNYLIKIEDNEVVSRLLLSGVHTINVINYDDVFRIYDKLDFDRVVRLDLNLNYTQIFWNANSLIPTYLYNPNLLNTVEEYKLNFNNLKADIHFNSTRFIGLEQLLSYFPSSLLFDSPRVAIKIPNNKVAKRAKRLLIFRTKSALANDWTPNDYGLVEIIDIERDINGDVITTMPNGEIYNGIYYFDEKKDKYLDFSNNPLDYEGLRFPLKSRFNIPIMERVFYLNFEETYQPIKPRDDLNNIWKYEIVEDSNGYKESTNVKYKIVYKDNDGVVSRESETVEFTVPAGYSVLFYLMPAGYDESIKYLELYRRKNKNSKNIYKFYKIGVVEQKDMGIFLDDDKTEDIELASTEPVVQLYESGVRWSEPYRPDWIKADSFVEYRSGDGYQITGVENNYGNLVIFKETSMHRVAVQGDNPPISRTDEITPELGLIAPNAIINVDNTLYFLSWKGFMVYDNNIIKKIDMRFTDELQFILTNTEEKWIREASCGYNPKYQEIYLNISMLPTKFQYTVNYSKVPSKVQREYGEAEFHNYIRKHYGHIYVLSLDKEYVTKFGYIPTTPYRRYNNYYYYPKAVIHPCQLIRKYFTNSLGEMRSADIMPSAYYTRVNRAFAPIAALYWAGIHIETPYTQQNNNEIYYKDVDDIISDEHLRAIDWGDISGITRLNDIYINRLNLQQISFPIIKSYPYKNVFYSKFFTLNTETILKRIRNFILNIYSKGTIEIRGVSVPIESIDERIDNEIFSKDEEVFQFNPTINLIDPYTGVNYNGTQRNILTIIPRIAQGVTFSDREGPITSDVDWYAKPIRYSIEIESFYRTQINELTLNLRIIHPYIM